MSGRRRGAYFCGRSHTAPVRNDHLVGGYGCELAMPPPEHLQTECSICLHILRDPHLVDCCGNSFCQTCITKLKRKPCPLCNVKFTTVVADKRLHRTLNGLKVYCSNKDKGCEWSGTLGEFDDHLNTNPRTFNRSEGCSYTKLCCIHCYKEYQRQELKKHEGRQCLERPYTCSYCKKYKSTYKEVSNNHWQVCESFLINCPSKCGLKCERKYVESHIVNDCPLVVVSCDFEFCGCKDRITRKDKPDHLKEHFVEHMSLLAISHSQQKAEFGKLERENKQMKTVIDKQAVELEQLKEDFHKVSSVALKPVILTMKNFDKHKVDDDTWYSDSFYTHPQGYKMCLRVDANGVEEIKSNAVSTYVCLMPGEFDDYLKWPFRGTISIDLTNCREVVVTCNISFKDSSYQESCARVKPDKIRGKGLGRPLFISHCDLYKALPQLASKQADSLIFQITVKDLDCV